MRKFILSTISIIVTIAGFQACKQNYDPPAIDSDLGLLVMDGFLNNSSDTTFLTLSRTAKLQEGMTNKGELNASITINDANGNPIYYFQPFNDRGTYFLPGMNLGNGIKYKLAINTANGLLYESDEIEAKATPPIDSIHWERTSEGLNIFSTTHDPDGKSIYYRWDFTETWEYYSNYYSDIVYENSVMRFRQMPQEQIFRCWSTRQSTDLLIASSAKLSADVIYRNPLKQIPLNGVELSREYSINVRQYALEEDAFNYLVNLKKITEQRGSIFDAQPTELPGNIHCINKPNEPVLGFAMASTMQSKRIFIKNQEVMPWRYSFYCEQPYLVPPIKDSLDFYFGSGRYYTPIQEVRSPTGLLIGYDGAVADCVDCKMRGGTTEKPIFWP